MASTVLPNGIIIPEKYSRDWYADLYHNWQELDNLLGGGTPKDGTLTIQKNGDTVGTFSANQATNETINITVPDVNNGTLTIQQNGTTVDTFTANSSTDKTVNISVPTNTSELTNGAGFITADYAVPRSGGAVLSGTNYSRTVNDSALFISGGTTTSNGGTLLLYGKDSALYAGLVSLIAQDSSNRSQIAITPTGAFTFSVNGTAKNVAMQEDVIPRSGGAVMTGDGLYKANASSSIFIGGGDERNHGGNILLMGARAGWEPGTVVLGPNLNGQERLMYLKPDGTWTWNGTACQIISDQRLKQQISKIDDKLLDAWEDVDLVQFKYNDAVKEKSDNARLHTGYVVQQIDSACKSHGVDVSAYGLYCHEEYPQEVEEVEVEQKDGTKVKETKVIREASEHYSLRYTEVYAVECMYLRRCIKQLTARIEELEKGNNTK